MSNVIFETRETALLFKDGVSSANNRERIAIVVSHELAHQWFGNLVTPSWWTDLWLNEVKLPLSDPLHSIL